MLIEQTITKLYAMKLNGMAEGLKEQVTSTEAASLNFEDRIALLVDYHWTWKEDRALKSRVKKAKLKMNACVEDIDYRSHRGLSKEVVAQLSLSNWILEHQNCTITGPTGVGKTYLAMALGDKACRNGLSVRCITIPKLFREIAVCNAQGTLPSFLSQLTKINLLIIDDWGFDSLNQSQYRIILEILDDRHQTQSTLITSQFPIKHWFDSIGNPTLADAILDRIIHNCHKIELKGESMRKSKSKTKKGENVNKNNKKNN